MTLPNCKNWCGGNYRDWMEVMLTEKCNGKCSWCVEKDGFKPEKHAEIDELIIKINTSPAKNIILLGGEPTLYKELSKLVEGCSKTKNLYITTNGSRLTPFFIEQIKGITGLNISIHNYDLIKNQQITGIKLKELNLINTIRRCYKHKISIRLNCNLIQDHIDSKQKILNYIRWAKSIGIGSVRFAELKNDAGSFVDLTKIYGTFYGINSDPYKHGCNHNCIIEGVSVNFRQMCGFQTPLRKRPENPTFNFPAKNVLYYDGNFYKGWQKEMTEQNEIKVMIRELIKEELKKLIKEEITNLSPKQQKPKEDYSQPKEIEKREMEQLSNLAIKYSYRIEPFSAHCQY